MTTGEDVTKHIVKTPEGVVSDKQSRDDSGCHEECYGEKKEATPESAHTVDSDNSHLDKGGLMNDLGEKAGLSCRTESEVLKKTAEKLDLLLAEQHKQLYEPKHKHELAVSNLLNGLTPEMRMKVFNRCSRKVPDYKMHCGLDLYSGNMDKSTSYLSPLSGVILNKFYNSPCVPLKKVFTRSASCIDVPVSPHFFDNLTKVGTPRMGAIGSHYQDNLNNFKCFNSFKHLCNFKSFNSFKRASESDLGIAVILEEDLEEDPHP